MSDIAALIETATNTSQGSFRRKMAVADLARSGEPQAIETLIGLLDDEDTYLRREVVSGLAKTEAPAVVEPLIGILHDDDDYLQRDAAEALGRFGDRRATEALRKLLDDDSYSVRYAAERSLKQIEQREPPRKEMDEPPSAITKTASDSAAAESS
jgi:HEAT repeat protein